MNTTSVSLLERLKQPDDQEAWSRFVDLYAPMIYSWARRTGLQEADAADIVQDVFSLLVQKMPEFTYDPRKSFRAWLKTVTLNKWREKLRRAAPLTVGTGFRDLAADADSDAFWEVEYQQHLIARAVRVMQADFEPATWQACWAVVVEGRPAGEVATRLGLSAGAVYAARFRVLARLRLELAGLLD